MLTRIVDVLSRCVPRLGPEKNLAEDIVQALTLSGISFRHEATLTTGRVDIRCGPIVVELKVQGSTKMVLQQLERYSKDHTVTSIVLVTTSRKIAATMPKSVGKKPLTVVYLLRL